MEEFNEQNDHNGKNPSEDLNAQEKSENESIEVSDISKITEEKVPLDESKLSPAELYEIGQIEAAEAQAEAERWADEQGMTHWSDGTPRGNYNSEAEEAQYQAITQAETDAHHDEDSTLSADIDSRNAELRQQYLDKLSEIEAVRNSQIDAPDADENARIANIQYELGGQLDQIKAEMMKNMDRKN